MHILTSHEIKEILCSRHCPGFFTSNDGSVGYDDALDLGYDMHFDTIEDFREELRGHPDILLGRWRRRKVVKDRDLEEHELKLRPWAAM
mmetsp:Transcript_11154/g.25841  ORF Transcript_11154/g.25841 Transcript_11154/m.25841 type:complete len:89 (-) Transcript_11154:111-377(-)